MVQEFGHTGSGGFTSWGQIDLSDFMGKLKQLYTGIESDAVYPKALRKGATYLRDLIEANTPIRQTNLDRSGEPSKKYNTKYHVKLYHPPGQAKRSVIVYQRKGNNSFYQGEINANLSLLVGYGKKMAFYMYWREVGDKFQPARPVIRPIFDAHIDEALQIAMVYIAQELNNRLPKVA